MGCSELICWPNMSHGNFQINQAIAMDIDCSPQIESKAIWWFGNSWPKGSDSIIKCWVGVPLLNEVSNHESIVLWGPTFKHCLVWKRTFSCLPVEETVLQIPQYQNVELSDPPPASCLPVCCHAYCPDNNGLNLWNCKPSSIKCHLLELPWSWCLFIAMEP